MSQIKHSRVHDCTIAHMQRHIVEIGWNEQNSACTDKGHFVLDSPQCVSPDATMASVTGRDYPNASSHCNISIP